MNPAYQSNKGEEVDEAYLRKNALALFGEDADLEFGNQPKDTKSQETTRFEDKDDKSTESEENYTIVDFSVPTTTVNDKKPAWVDEDDEKIAVADVAENYTKFRGKRGIREVSDEAYEQSLRKKFNNLHGDEPEWAKLNRKVDDDDDEEEELTKRTGSYLKKGSFDLLPTTRINIKELKDMNHTTYSEGSLIKCAEFCPNANDTPLALVAGCKGNSYGAASLFQMDGVNNYNIHTVKFKKFPVKSAHFTADGKKFIVGSNLYGHFFVHDILSSNTLKIPWNKSEDRRNMGRFKVSPNGKTIIFIGKDRQLHLFDANAFSHVDTLQSPSNVHAITFNTDGTRMYTYGEGGDIFIWDMTTRSCIHKFYDEGSIEGTSISLSPNNYYLACGSSSGIVNIYETSALEGSFDPKPIKVISNLVTRVNSLKFNSTSELLAMASSDTHNAIKLIHFPSMTVFSNFPNAKKDLRRCQTIDISPNSGYLSIGNNGGCAYLYRLKHYKSY